MGESMFRVALCVVGCILALSITTPSHSSQVASSEGLSLELTLDDQSYTRGQPIILLVKVRNVGVGDFYDLGPLDPQVGHLALALERNNKNVPWTGGRLSVVYTETGIRLAPGAVMCEVVNLLDWFGERSNLPVMNSQGAEANSIPSGSYKLHVLLAARTGFDRSLQQVTVRGADLAFEVTDGPLDIPPEARSVVSLPAHGASEVQLAPSAKKGLLERGADSKSFYLLWRRVRPSEIDYPVQDALALLAAHKRSSVLMAAVLNHRCKTLQLHNSEKLEWIGKMRGAMKDPDLVAVLDGWRLKIEQHRYYYEF